MIDLTDKWLALAAAVYLLVMILYGHWRGFFRMAVTAVSLVLTMTAAHYGGPALGTYLRENTGIYQTVGENIASAAGLDTAFAGTPASGTTPLENADTTGNPSLQREVIEALNLPSQMKDALVENNNSEIYHLLGVDSFADYLVSYLANSVMNIVCFLAVFAAVYALIRVLVTALDIISHIPVIHGLNQILGGVVGAAVGLFVIWILMLFITAFQTTPAGGMLMDQIAGSAFLSCLYRNNMLSMIALETVKHTL